MCSECSDIVKCECMCERLRVFVIENKIVDVYRPLFCVHKFTLKLDSWRLIVDFIYSLIRSYID